MLLNPSDLTAAFERTYPRVFSLIEDTRLRAIANGESWPAWCYAPIAASQAVMSKSFGVSSPATMAAESAKAAGLAAWRMGGKNVLVFDDAVLAELWSTPVTGDIPTDVLLHLPFWGAYIPLPAVATERESVAGVFVHLEQDANTKRPELRFLVHLSSDDLMMIPLDVDKRVSLEEAVRRTFPFALTDVPEPERAMTKAYLEVVRALTEPLVSITLYLCAANAEIRAPNTNAPAVFAHQNPRKRVFAASQPTTWNVAWRIGAALRRAREAVKKYSAGAAQGGTKIPHMRRQHWHWWRTGKRSDPSTWDYVSHWIPPTPVNMPEGVDQSEWADLLPTTERKI